MLDTMIERIMQKKNNEMKHKDDYFTSSTLSLPLLFPLNGTTSSQLSVTVFTTFVSLLIFSILFKNTNERLNYCSVTEDLPSMHKILGLIPSTPKIKQNKIKFQNTLSAFFISSPLCLAPPSSLHHKLISQGFYLLADFSYQQGKVPRDKDSCLLCLHLPYR